MGALDPGDIISLVMLCNGCTSLVGGNGYAYNENYPYAYYGRINTATVNGYLTASS